MQKTFTMALLALALSVGCAQAATMHHKHMIPACAPGAAAPAKCVCGTARAANRWSASPGSGVIRIVLARRNGGSRKVGPGNVSALKTPHCCRHATLAALMPSAGTNLI